MRQVVVLCVYLVILMAVALGLSSRAPKAPQLPYGATVVNVVDGDTLDVQDFNQIRHRIRLTGIDAPEHDQTCGYTAKHRLIQLAQGRKVMVYPAKHSSGGWGREVARVHTEPDNRDVGLAMVHDGYAWIYLTYKAALENHLIAYKQAETDALACRRGLWKAKVPEPPWVFRDSKHKRLHPIPSISAF